MAEVGYTEGYNFMANLGKGKALLGMYITSTTNSDTITTPFARCVPVLTPAVACAGDSVIKVAAPAGGVITVTALGTQIDAYQALIIGDLY